MFYNRRFFSIRTRHHLCRQALTLLQAASSPFPTPGARARALYREGGTRSEAWREGANGNRDGDGDGAKTVTGTGTEIGNADGRGGTRLGWEHRRRRERERKQGQQRRWERGHEHEWKRENDKGRTLPTVGLTGLTRESVWLV